MTTAEPGPAPASRDVGAARRARLARTLSAAGADAALVTAPANVRWLTGLASSNASVLVRADGSALLATDGRYAEEARTVAADLELLVERETEAALARRAVAGGAAAVAVETHVLSVDAFGALAEVVAEAVGAAGRAPGSARLVPLGRAVEGLREVKDDAEVAAIRAAAALADRALVDLLAAGGVRPGRVEREVAADLEGRMRALGADGPAFDTIVGSGPRSALPHARPGERVLRAGDLVVLDFGARLAGYHSDCTRTVVLGPPAPWQRDLHALVRAAQAAGTAALRPGVEAAAVDAAARAVIVDAGHGDDYPHGLGHGVGLEVHEAPSLGRTAPGRIAGRAVVTVEPGVYLPGRGGVRVEDLLVVTETGPELLTTTPAGLLELS